MEIIVTGHGNFASGLKSTITLLAGEIQNTSYIDFLENMSEKDLKKEFVNILEKSSDGAVFFCDLVGGTPYKQAALLTTEYSNISVVAGCNIGSLLEVGLLNQSDDSQKVSELLMEGTSKGIRRFGQLNITQEFDGDGI